MLWDNDLQFFLLLQTLAETTRALFSESLGVESALIDITVEVLEGSRRALLRGRAARTVNVSISINMPDAEGAELVSSQIRDMPETSISSFMAANGFEVAHVTKGEIRVAEQTVDDLPSALVDKSVSERDAPPKTKKGASKALVPAVSAVGGLFALGCVLVLVMARSRMRSKVYATEMDQASAPRHLAP